MEPWQLIALLAAGAFGIGSIASSSAKSALVVTQPAPPTLSSSDSDLLNKVFQAAMAQETNLSILQNFAKRLYAADQKAYGDAIQQKHDHLSRYSLATISRTDIQMVPQS